MEDDGEIIVELLQDLFGKEKQHYRNKGQIAFNCPVCDYDKNKGNLEINYNQHVFKCWSCGDVKELTLRMFREFYQFMWMNRSYWEPRLRNA